MNRSAIVRVLIGPPALQRQNPRDDPRPGSPENPARPAPERDATPRRHTVTPPIDIHDDGDGLVLVADLPGADESSIMVQLEDNVLHLYARVNPDLPPGLRLVHQEYPVADYARAFILSHEVDRDRIRAELRSGVLRVWLPRARGLSRRIEVKGS